MAVREQTKEFLADARISIIRDSLEIAASLDIGRYIHSSAADAACCSLSNGQLQAFLGVLSNGIAFRLLAGLQETDLEIGGAGKQIKTMSREAGRRPTEDAADLVCLLKHRFEPILVVASRASTSSSQRAARVTKGQR